PRAEVAEVPVERRVVERERALEAEPDRPGRLGLAHFEESQMEHVGNEERLGQPAEEDLHPGLHELPLGPGTRTMKLQEAVHVWCERRRSGDGDPVLTDLAAEPSLFPPDLMAQLGGERRKVLAERRRELDHGRRAVALSVDPKAERAGRILQ